MKIIDSYSGLSIKNKKQLDSLKKQAQYWCAKRGHDETFLEVIKTKKGKILKIQRKCQTCLGSIKMKNHPEIVKIFNSTLRKYVDIDR